MNLREQLKTAGLTDEQASHTENIIRQYVAGEYIPKHRFDEVSNKNTELSKEIGRIESEKTSIEKKLKKAEEDLAPLQEKLTKTDLDWQQKYQELQASYKKQEEDRITLELYNTRTNAVKDYIKDTAHDTDMVLSLLDFESLEVKDGKVFGVDKAVEALRKDKAFLFKGDDWASTAPTSAPKGEPGGVNFGQFLANKASESDALTQAAAKKYFG